MVQPSCDHTKNKSCPPVTHVTWATEFGYQWEDYVGQYVASIYYTFATLLTVGYGDIHAVNVPGTFYSSPNSFVPDMCLSFTHRTSNTPMNN